MLSKRNILFVILLYFLGKGSSSEVVSVKRNVVDSFLVGENGCRDEPSVCTTRSATCQPDGWCLCTSSRQTFWKSAIKKGRGYGYVDGCVSNDYIRAGVGGTDYSPFSYEVISSGINDTATFYLDEGIRNAGKCVWKSVRGRFPNNETEIKLIWLWNWVIELTTTSSKNELYLKWKKDLPMLQTALLTLVAHCPFESGWNDYYLRAKVLGTWTKVPTCLEVDWSSSFDRKGWSKCDKDNHFITEFYRSGPYPKEITLSLLDKVRCCSASAAFKDEEVECTETCWKEKPNHRHWAKCPWGYFLSGLYRNENQTLSDIDCGYCCKPKNIHPSQHFRCYDNVAEDHEKKITKPGWFGCQVDGYYVNGFVRGNHTDSLGTLDWLKCCQYFTEDVSQSTTPATTPSQYITSQTTELNDTALPETEKPRRVPSDNSDEENQMYYAILAVGFVFIVALGIAVGVLWRKLKRMQEQNVKETENIEEEQNTSQGTDDAVQLTVAPFRGENKDAFSPHSEHNEGSSADYEEAANYQPLAKNRLNSESDENSYQSLITTDQQKELQV